jgi:DNA end-binding protein Ku
VVPKERAAEAPRNVINLMDALRRSVAAGKGSAPAADAAPKAAPKVAPKTAAPAKSPPAKKGKKRAEGQREMLLPIAGKKAAAKETAREKPAARRKAG